MKKTIKKMSKVLGVSVLSSLIISTAASAATPMFYYNIANNGQSYSENYYGGTNTKVYAGEAWSFKTVSIYFSGGVTGAGMAFRLKNTRTGSVSNVTWAASTGVRYGSWNDGGPTGTYKIQGRMDDELGGRCEAVGYWNADIINSWPG